MLIKMLELEKLLKKTACLKISNCLGVKTKNLMNLSK